MEQFAIWCAIIGGIIAIFLFFDERKRRKKYGKPMTKEQFDKIMATDPYKIIKTKIVDSSHTATTQKKTGSTIVRAVVGGAVAGGVGAVVGASTGKNKVVEKHKTTFLVYYEGGLTTTKTVDNDSNEYHKLIQKLEV